MTKRLLFESRATPVSPHSCQPRSVESCCPWDTISKLLREQTCPQPHQEGLFQAWVCSSLECSQPVHLGKTLICLTTRSPPTHGFLVQGASIHPSVRSDLKHPTIIAVNRRLEDARQRQGAETEFGIRPTNQYNKAIRRLIFFFYVLCHVAPKRQKRTSRCPHHRNTFRFGNTWTGIDGVLRSTSLVRTQTLLKRNLTSTLARKTSPLLEGGWSVSIN